MPGDLVQGLGPVAMAAAIHSIGDVGQLSTLQRIDPFDELRRIAGRPTIVRRDNDHGRMNHRQSFFRSLKRIHYAGCEAVGCGMTGESTGKLLARAGGGAKVDFHRRTGRAVYQGLHSTRYGRCVAERCRAQRSLEHRQSDVLARPGAHAEAFRLDGERLFGPQSIRGIVHGELEVLQEHRHD